jgi:hypothetical protein
MKRLAYNRFMLKCITFCWKKLKADVCLGIDK